MLFSGIPHKVRHHEAPETLAKQAKPRTMASEHTRLAITKPSGAQSDTIWHHAAVQQQDKKCISLCTPLVEGCCC